ncbi:TolC family protein [Limnohabitans sp.]|uniref:TolC family protein n=1 Tax=Limnohabitans sp. TaxID=1907725 RepID=UPI00286EDA38|nr:TolC family protein [Limnohabitans sp.]
MFAAELIVGNFLSSVALSHPSVLAAQADVRAAQAELDAAWRQMLPEMQVSTSRPTNQDSNSTLITQPKSTVAVEQKLWAGGKYTSSVNVAEAASNAMQARLDEVRLSATLAAIEALQGFRAATQKLDVNRQTLERLSRFVSMMERRVESQVSPPIDAVLVRSRMVQAKIDHANAQAAKSVSISRLQQLGLSDQAIDWSHVGMPQLGEPLLTGLPKNGEAAWRELDGLIDSHPSVRRAFYEAEAARHRQSASAADQFPTVYARVEKNRYDNPNYASQNGVIFTYVGVRFTPGGGLVSMAQAKAAQEKAQSAQQQIETSRRDQTNQLRQDWEEWRSALERRSDYVSALSNAMAVSESYERQFIVGRMSWQQTLDAVRELGQMGLAMADTESSLWASSYRLMLRQGLYDLQQGVMQ